MAEEVAVPEYLPTRLSPEGLLDTASFLQLAAEGKLRRFAHWFGATTDGEKAGDCIRISLSIIQDLAELGAENGWFWAKAEIKMSKKRAMHAWIETANCIVDAQAGRLHFWSPDDFNAEFEPTGVESVNADLAHKWYETNKSKLGAMRTEIPEEADPDRQSTPSEP